MNSMIENLVIDMRQLGIKSLALELLDDPGPPAIAFPAEERATLAPGDLCQSKCPDREARCTLATGHEGYCATPSPENRDIYIQWERQVVAEPVEPEFRGDPNQCEVVGCGEPNGGILGGKLSKRCRKHAFEKMGIR